MVALDGIGKSYPGVRALDHVSLEVRPGECHALVGENGAGKSTLLKILGGIVPWPEYDGDIRMDGRLRRFAGVADAEAAGVAVVHQELSLVGPLSCADNIALGHEPRRGGIIDRAAVAARARDALASLGADVDPDVPVERLGIGQQQLVEIAKALARDARVLVLDEPTAALTDRDAEHLLARLAELRARGMAIVYVSHRLDEVLRVADRITVLRDGRSVASGDVQAFDEPSLVAAMVGRTVETLFPGADRTPGAVVLSVRALSIGAAGRRSKRLLDEVTMDVRAGEIVGLAGLMGSGRTTLLTSIFGAPPGPVSGEVLLDGRPVSRRSPREAISRGLALLTEDRTRFGLFLDEPVTDNVTIAALRAFARRGVTRPAVERRAALEAARDLAIRASSLDVPARTLSGGNQQKVLAARWLLTRPRVLLLDEPTRGIDVGARAELYALVDRLAREGLAVVVASSDLPEVLGLADRVLVMRQGRIVSELPRAAATPEAVMAAATGTGVPTRDVERSSYTGPAVPLLTIIVPVYNEAPTVAAVIERLRTVPLPLDREILVVDDGSTDGTRQVLARLSDSVPGVRVVLADRNAGKGSAVRLGLSHARGSILAIQDADLELDPAEIGALVEPVLSGSAQVVYGSRFLAGPTGAPFATVAGNRFLTMVTNVLFGGSLTDMETCYKIMTTDLARSLDLTCDSFDIEPEITAKLLRRSIRIRELPVRFEPRSRAQGKKIRWRHGLTALGVLFRERLR